MSISTKWLENISGCVAVNKTESLLSLEFIYILVVK